MEPLDLMSAPIPGQSLTTAPGNANWEQPPQFVNAEIALEYIWERITQPKRAYQIGVLLKKGVPAEYIARTLVFTGFANGKWSPDLSLLIARPVLYQVVAIGAMQKVKDIKIFNKREDKLLGILTEEDVAAPPPPEPEPEMEEDMLEGEMEEEDDEDESEEEDMPVKKGLLD